jgi:hypothetical protein
MIQSNLQWARMTDSLAATIQAVKSKVSTKAPGLHLNAEIGVTHLANQTIWLLTHVMQLVQKSWN